MEATQLRRILRKGRKLKCAKCPISQATCKKLSEGLWGEDKCLVRVVLREVLIFHCEDKKSSVQPIPELGKGILKTMKAN